MLQLKQLQLILLIITLTIEKRPVKEKKDLSLTKFPSTD